MGSYTQEPEPQNLWIETPCIPSTALSKAAGCNIFLKLENLQPSGSFKSRGIGNMMRRALAASPTPDRVHFYCSSGGNAGLACATAAVALARPCTIVMPTVTPAHMVAKLRALGADVHQTGAHWAAADAYMREKLLAHDAAGVYVPPFDHPHIWEGASTLVDELARQLPPLLRAAVGASSSSSSSDTAAVAVAPDAIVCSVGGGGLLNGVMAGIKGQKAWEGARNKPRVLAVETEGAESLHASVRAGRLVTLPRITSIATNLGAATVSARAFEWSQTAGPHDLVSAVVSDADAALGSVRLADDARLLVEVSCGASVCVVYNGLLRERLGEGLTDDEWARRNVVLIVCGGSNVSLELLKAYKDTFNIK